MTQAMTRDQWQQRVKDIKRRAGPKHKPKAVTVGSMSDHYECSCGWRSPGYWDGLEWAFEDWAKHVDDVELSRVCAE